MKVSKEKEKYYISRIRRELVSNRASSVLEVQTALEGCSEEPLHLDKNYINRLMNKLRGEQAKRLDRYTLNVALAEFEDFVDESNRLLWLIVDDEKTSVKDKIAALRALLNNRSTLFDAMFDAGVFERQGRIGIETNEITFVDFSKNKTPAKSEEKMSEEEKALMAKTLDYVLHPDQPTKYIEPNSEGQAQDQTQ